ncbi:tRNA dihydrouridine(20/20a) synthase DusA [Thiomicrorhabdus xiamenensis]|uniref:tRNA-dihydrouridine(20/20a) synthase n=1 Tax=Thiomicrorhabdus xiamenensis TaxID=2739063 RepID=A0A7D4T0F9_9GAMM|nr:tRNA dihydrouridine(20/20a) synthase DusA [Thiomicrorhabdus xiamenensis]QKI89182.1 tRNA dihydrouridine(20/20a) synthase DusA [Thiomicrorhabdus xiamenensis]
MPTSLLTPTNAKSNKENSAQHFSVAPMLDWTDRHCRHFHRKLSKRTWLYSEMVTTGAIIYGNNLPRFLGQDKNDAPVVLQLGGSNPTELAQCAAIAEEWGYSEVNLNVGCPSDRVQNNMIGACLMAHPNIVAEAVDTMKSATQLPVTVKCRLGIDEQNEEESVFQFVEALNEVNTDGVIIHARKAWLQGISPKENREIPPLNYDLVHQVKNVYQDLPIAINGGIKTLQSGMQHLDNYHDLPALDGFMIGRSAYEQPYLLAEADQLLYGSDERLLTRKQVVEQMYDYIENHLQQGGKLIQVTRHMLGLFHGLPGGRMWRRYLSQNAFKAEAGLETLQEALRIVEDEIERMAEQLAQKENTQSQ